MISSECKVPDYSPMFSFTLVHVTKSMCIVSLLIQSEYKLKSGFFISTHKIVTFWGGK